MSLHIKSSATSCISNFLIVTKLRHVIINCALCVESINLLKVSVGFMNDSDVFSHR